jgi:hypothetical protein
VSACGGIAARGLPSKQETEGKTACSTSLAFGKAPPFREVLFTVDHLKAAYLHLGGTL